MEVKIVGLVRIIQEVFLDLRRGGEMVIRWKRRNVRGSGIKKRRESKNLGGKGYPLSARDSGMDRGSPGGVSLISSTGS